VFTLHAGEALAGEHIARAFRGVSIWVPAKDSGIDFLVTDSGNRRSVSLQIKFSRDFLVTHLRPEFQTPLRACGWWTFHRKKLLESPADYWVLLLMGFAHRSNDYIIIPPKELARRLQLLHGKQSRLQTYLWITQSGQCWETRGLQRREQERIAEGTYRHTVRNFHKYLNNWAPLARLNRKGR
jgi:hypothetical protein